jgi:hypothetical protein
MTIVNLGMSLVWMTYQYDNRQHKIYYHLQPRFSSLNINNGKNIINFYVSTTAQHK